MLRHCFACRSILLLTLLGDALKWESSYEAALKRADAESKVIFLVTNMDGNDACDEMAVKTYSQSAFVLLTSETVNLIASPDIHGKGPCTRFPGISCSDHQSVDTYVRKNLLKATPDGGVVAPQHIFLDAQGRVLLSVPYRITKDELEWCFLAARQKANPQAKISFPATARAPKELIVGDVFDPKKVPGGFGGRPLNRTEVLEVLKRHREGKITDQEDTALAKVMTSDVPEAVEFVKSEYVRLWKEGKSVPALIGSLDTIGKFSPPSYWVVIEPFVEEPSEEVRAACGMALEQLGAQESLKLVQKALSKEKSLEAKKCWIRALGVVGREEKKVHAQLLKISKEERDDVLKYNAIIALGSCTQTPEIQKFLMEGLRGGKQRVRIACGCAIGISRDQSYFAFTASLAINREPDEKVNKLIWLLGDAVANGKIGPLRSWVKEVAEDKVERARFFGFE